MYVTESHNSHRANPRIRTAVCHCRHRRRQRRDFRAVGSARRVGQRAGGDRAVRRNGAGRLARRNARHTAANGPRERWRWRRSNGHDELSDADPHTLRGIGATASLASNRPKRGPHRIHVAWQSADTTAVASCEFPSEGTRADEEQMATQLILHAVAEACGVDGNSLERSSASSGASNMRRLEWTELLLGTRKSVAIMPANAQATARPILFPGAFNPIHARTQAHGRSGRRALRQSGHV